MKRLLFVTAAAAALAFLPAQALEAQMVDLGAQVSYNTDATDDGAFGVGARLAFGLPMTGLGVHGDFNWYFPDCDPADCDLWEITGALTYTIPTMGTVSPYFGAGMAYQSFSVESTLADADDSETGFNVLGGLKLGGLLPVSAFGEVGYRLMDEFDDQLVVTVGIMF